MAKKHRIFVKRDVTRSVHGFIEAPAMGKRILTDNWIVVEEPEFGHFVLVDENLTRGEYSGPCLGFLHVSREVERLDWDDPDLCWVGVFSCHCRWKDVEMQTHEFWAPTLHRLKQALEHVAFCTWNPRDV